MSKLIITPERDTIEPEKTNYHIILEGYPHIWSSGTTVEEAIGRWFRSYHSHFGFEITYNCDPKRYYGSEQAAEAQVERKLTLIPGGK